jgi:ribose transport system ATP-binding protein
VNYYPTSESMTSTVAAAGPPAVMLRDVSKSFGAVAAMRGVSISIGRGEIHAIVGENGAGKSTLIGIVAGVLSADSGTISFEGAVVDAPKPDLMRKLGVAVIYQHPAIAPDLTVLENLQLAHPSLNAVEAERMLDEISTEKLRPPLNVRAGELSIAHHHIVEIARALAGNPRVLIFDEPTEPFQQAEIRKLFAIIRVLRARGVAIVYVSHRLHEVMELADRISVMRDGEIIESRARAEIDTSQIIDLIAGRSMTQIFPSKSGNFGKPIFEVANLTGRGFSGVDLVARAGEIVGLAGVEGEGQREFLRAAAGVGHRASGALAVDGRVVAGNNAGASHRAGVGFVSDDRHAEGLFLALSVRENLGVGLLERLGRGGLVDRGAEMMASKAVVDAFKIRTPSLETEAASLSGGNQQKIVIGREMAATPKALLVDEPTKGVDIAARSEIYLRLRRLAAEGLAVVVASSDGLELEGLCDRVLIFARGQVVRELTGLDVTDAKITEANLTATVSRADNAQRSVRRRSSRRLLSSDHFPAIVLAALTAVVLVGMQIKSPYFLTGYNIATMLSFLAILACVSIGQLATILVGGIDLSVGALAGLSVVLASFFAPDGASLFAVIGGSLLVILCSAGFGLLQGLLIAEFGLPAIVVTLASFIGLQGVSLFLRPNPDGTISDTVSDIVDFPVFGVPACMVFALLAVATLEFTLYRTALGRRVRAVGSNSLATLRLGIRNPRQVLLAFAFAGSFTGIAGVLLAGKIGIGSADTGIDYTIMSITAVVLGGASIAGGRGSVISTLMGAGLVQVVSTASSFINADSSVHYTALGVITLLAAIFFSLARRRHR